MPLRAATILLIMLAGVSGCGTIRNLSQTPEVYGGVKIDNEVGVKYRERRPAEEEHDIVNAAKWVATVVDLPLSAVADTVTLPYVLHVQSQAASTEMR
jgi:uncharacterized protein YceK